MYFSLEWETTQRNVILRQVREIISLIDNATLCLSYTRWLSRNVLHSSGRYCCNSSLSSIVTSAYQFRKKHHEYSIPRDSVAFQIWHNAVWREYMPFWNVTKVEYLCYLAYVTERNSLDRRRTRRAGRKETDRKVIRYLITIANQKWNSELSVARHPHRRLLGLVNPQSKRYYPDGLLTRRCKRSRNLHIDPAIIQKKIEKEKDANDTGVYIDTISED